jgi:GNAT superfamily N-acetyltransferase
MGIQVDQVDTTTAPVSLLREMASFYLVAEAEDMPDDPPTPLEARIAGWRHVKAHHPQVRWQLRDDAGIAAVAVAAYDTEQNLANGFGRIFVHPDKRNRGHARALATPLFDHLEAQGRSRFATWIKQDHPAEGLARALGLEAVYEDKRSRLYIAELDRDLMRSWIARASERAAEYDLVYHRSPLPDDLLQKFCDLAFVMNTAPREEYTADDEILTPDAWRDIERTVIDAKGQLHHLIAVHEPTGALAGYTQINTQELHPDLAWNWDTGVDPDHRNKGLGRWLKAAMIERIIDGYPAVDRVDTFNAGSNEPMLKINLAMGFRPVHISHVWQGDLATTRERLRA